MSSASTPALLPFLMVGGFFAFIALVVWIAAKTAEKTRLRLEQLAMKLGLTIEPVRVTMGIFHHTPKITGQRRGKNMEIFTYTTGAGKSRVHWAAIAATPRADGGLTFSLTRQGFGSKIAQLFGTREIQVGDPGFDGTWFIQTNRPDFFGAALLPELRTRITDATRNASRGASFKLEHGRVVYAEVGSFYDEARCLRFEGAADVVCDLADVAEVHADLPRS